MEYKDTDLSESSGLNPFYFTEMLNKSIIIINSYSVMHFLVHSKFLACLGNSIRHF